MRTNRLAQKFIVVLFIVSLNGCSVVGKLWYNKLDIYLSSYFFKYADFSYTQKDYIKQISKEFHRWNSQYELPKYKNLLIEVKNLNNETTSEDIEKISNKGRGLLIASNNFFIPNIVTFCKGLTDKQVIEISLTLKERIYEWESSLEESKKKSYIKSSLDSFEQLARFLGVKLTKIQKIEIQKLLVNLKDSRSDSIENQRIWNVKLISILRSREEENFNSILTIHLHSLLERERTNERENIYYEMITVTLASLDKNQRGKFQKRINFFINSIDKIIKSQQ